MAKGLFPRAWVKKSFYFQVISLFGNCSAMRISVKLCTAGCEPVYNRGRRGVILTVGSKHAPARAAMMRIKSCFKIPEECERS